MTILYDIETRNIIIYLACDTFFALFTKTFVFMKNNYNYCAVINATIRSFDVVLVRVIIEEMISVRILLSLLETFPEDKYLNNTRLIHFYLQTIFRVFDFFRSSESENNS